MTRIVLIEDDDLMREWLGRSLSSRGHIVQRYRRADEAIEAVSADPPDVLVSDVHMPGMSGLDLARALRARGIMVPLVMMSADPSDDVRSRAEAVGARCLLQKPFADVADFWRAVEDAAAVVDCSPADTVTGVSHALRTPLTAIRMALDGLTSDREMDPKERRLAEIAHRNLDRLAAALEDHLDKLAVAVEEGSTAE